MTFLQKTAFQLFYISPYQFIPTRLFEPAGTHFHLLHRKTQGYIYSDLLHIAFILRRTGRAGGAGRTGGRSAAAGFPRLNILYLFIDYKYRISQY
jgi:hypothetical protein